MNTEVTRLLRNAVQALVALAVGFLMRELGFDLVEVFDWFGVKQSDVENLIYILLLPLTSAAVAWLEKKLPDPIGNIVGLLNGPRRKVEYTKAA